MTGPGAAAPQTYQQWLECFEMLSTGPVSGEYVESLKHGSCPGIEKMTAKFDERLQETVNRMMNRATKHCTRSLNEALEEGDFSYIEVILRRCRREIEHCRFYRELPFLQAEFRDRLDMQVVKETNRYWDRLKGYLAKLIEETESAELYDLLYYIKRLSA